MNFKPLKDKKEYENTKKLYKEFYQQMLDLDNEIALKNLQRKEIAHADSIFWQEIQDYENRNYIKE